MLLVLPDDDGVEDEDEDEDEDDDDDSLEVEGVVVLEVSEDDGVDDGPGPLAELVLERESLMYQPLPLKTMPTGWMILRKVPPHCSQVVSRGSEKLWRFSIMSLQAVHV